MDKQDEQDGVTANGHVDPGISMAMGPVEEMDVDKPAANGATTVGGKRKASMTNGKSYKENSESDDEDDVPLVRACYLAI